MRLLEDCSGPWRGLWIQGLVRGVMSVQLSIARASIVGRGADLDGPFEFRGAFDAASNEVVLEKRYPWLTVHYRGHWDGTMICGVWNIPGDDSGVFEMWPLDEELAISALIEQLALPEVTIRALPAPSP